MSSSSSSSSTSTTTTLTPADRATIEACFGTLLKLLEKLESESSQPLTQTVTVDSARLNDYCEILSHAITKFVLFVSQGEVPILLSSSEELTNHLTGISCLLRTLLSPATATDVAPGKTQRTQIIQVHQQLLHGVRVIFIQLQSHLLAKSTTKLDASLTGRAWELIEKQLKTIPLTNATAVGRSINQQCSVMKDALAELKEVHLATEEELKEKAEGGDDDDDEDDIANDMDGLKLTEDDDAFRLDAGGDDALTAEEYEIIPAIQHLSNTATTLVKSLYMYLLKVKIDETKQSNIDWLESIFAQVQSIGQKLDDLIGSVYSPQDRAAVLTAIDDMTKELQANALSIVKHNFESNAEWPVKTAPTSSATSSTDSTATDSSSTTSSTTFAACASCQPIYTTAAALSPSATDEVHQQRLNWLQKCLTQIHEGHTLADKCAKR